MRKLKELIDGLPTVSISVDLETEVTGLSQDSRSFKKGDAFIALKGGSFDGHSFVSEAIKRGASAVFVERKTEGPAILVKSTKEILNILAQRFFGFPSEKLFLAGVTGTNGKTTTTYILEALLDCGVIGTIDCHFKSDMRPSSHTTPDPIVLESTLSDWLKLGAKAVAMEVSSHALDQNRADGLEFDVGIFTNLTRDHLDFHQTMENYILAKAKLFKTLLKASKKKNKRAILNCEDENYKKLMPENIPVWTYGFSTGDLKVKKMNLTLDGTDLEISTPLGPFQGRLNLIGQHNISNSLAALGAGLHYGLSPKETSERLSKLQGVPGRLQRVPSRNAVRVFVDYAHTDDGLVNVLSFLKQMRDKSSLSSKIITVFGCGGDRDKGKRPLMLKAALNGSDFVIVTSDNPRTENPGAIISDIIKDAPKALASKFAVIADRREAIIGSIERAKAGDIILIAGKGHENYQIIGTKKLPFDDLKIAKEILDS